MVSLGATVSITYDALLKIPLGEAEELYRSIHEKLFVLADFVALMNGLNLPYPRKMDFAVPGNQQCGRCPDNVLAEFRGPCERWDQG